MNALFAAEHRRMGRPKREEPMASVRITQAALDLVKEAAKLKGETIVDYLARIAAEHAKADIASEERRLRAIRHGKATGND